MADDVPQISQRSNAPVIQRLEAKANAMIAEMEGGPVDAPAGEATSETGAAESPPVGTSASEVTPPVVEESTEQAEARVIREKRAALYDEKLRGALEKRQAQRLAERAKADRKAAASDRRAAAQVAGEWDKIGKEGTYLEGIKKLGRDPRAEWEAMNREAIEAGTPEAQAKRERAELQRQIDAKLTPLQQEVEQLRAERVELAQQAHEQRLVTNFSSALADPSLASLRIEYSDASLLDYVRALIRTPEVLHETARLRNVQLTNPAKGFTMQEILRVLAAEQAAHDAGKQARRAAQAPAEAQAGKPPTVNGTAERRNAGTAIGNDLAAQRASAKAETPGLSIKEKVRLRAEAEIRRSGG